MCWSNSNSHANRAKFKFDPKEFFFVGFNPPFSMTKNPLHTPMSLLPSPLLLTTCTYNNTSLRHVVCDEEERHPRERRRGSLLFQPRRDSIVVKRVSSRIFALWQQSSRPRGPDDLWRTRHYRGSWRTDGQGRRQAGTSQACWNGTVTDMQTSYERATYM